MRKKGFMIKRRLTGRALTILSCLFFISLISKPNVSFAQTFKWNKAVLAEIEKNNIDALLKRIGRDISWVELETPVYLSRNPSAINLGENSFWTINSDGSGLHKICDGGVGDVVISPDGKYVLLSVSLDNFRKELVYLFDRVKRELKLIKEITGIIQQKFGEEEYIDKHYIIDLSWASDSKKFCYVIYNFSPFCKDAKGNVKGVASSSEAYIVSIPSFEEKCIMKDRNISENARMTEYIFWDKNNKNIYFMELKHGREKKLKMDLDSGKEFVIETIPKEQLIPQRKLLSPGWIQDKTVSENNEELFETGEKDRFRYVFKSNTGEGKMIISFPPSPYPGVQLHYFQRPAWLPGGRYALLQFDDYVVILEPSAGKMGVLAEGVYFSPIDYESKNKWVY